MRTSWWLVGALASALVGGCATRDVKEDQVKLGRLPMEQKEQIFTAEHNITVAEANKAAAERALEEAKVFASMADEEMDSAKARLEAARTGVELGRKTRDASTVRAAARQLDVAEKQLTAAQAKKEYADRLEELRREEIELADRQVAAARAEVVAARSLALRRNGLTPSVSEAEALTARDEANREVARQESTISSLRDQIGQLKVAWDRRRETFDVAARDIGDVPAIKAPKAGERIAPEPMKIPERDY